MKLLKLTGKLFFILKKRVFNAIPSYDKKMTTSVEYEVVYALQNDYLRM